MATLSILSVVVTPVNEVGKFLFGALKRQVDYLKNYSANIRKLRTQVKQLNSRRESVKALVEDAERRLDVPFEEVVEWLKNTEEVIKDALMVFDEDINANKCFSGISPDLSSRLKLSKLALVMIDSIDSLQEQANFSEIAHAPPPPPVEFVRIGSIIDGIPSRDSIMEEVMEALRDDNIRSVAVHGMGGIGKTTLLMRLNNELQGSQLFKKVIFVSLKRNADIRNIQDGIADSLRFSLSPTGATHIRANMLAERLKKDETVLVILDNVWNRISFTELGLPDAGEHLGCKVILSTRDFELCRKLRTQRNIQLNFISLEESWTLFKAKAGDVVDYPHLNHHAKQIVTRCKGSPLAIVTLGSTLRDVDDESVWMNASMVLSHPDSSGLEHIMPGVVESLKFSFDTLRVPEIKLCFLFCCLFPVDYNIKLSDLRNYGIGDRFLRSTRTLDDAFNELVSYVQTLKSCCLLLDGEEDMTVKMHDIVRDVAILIASDDSNGFYVNTGSVIDFKDTQLVNSSKRVSLMNNEMKFSDALKMECRQLQSLFIRGNNFPSIQGTETLAVLDLWSIYNWKDSTISRAESLSRLINLRTLYLIACDVSGNVSLLGGMKKLEVLCMRDSNVGRLENEICNLVNLRCLDMTGSEIEYIAPNAISSLSKLEELYMWNNFEGWGSKNKERRRRRGREQNASFLEVAELKHLSVLEIRVQDAVFHEIYSSGNLKKFRLAVNDDPERLEGYRTNNDICIKNANLGEHRFRHLISNTNRNLVLRLISCSGFRCVADLNGTRLEYLSVSRCNELEYVVRMEQVTTALSDPILGYLRVIRMLGCARLNNILSANNLLSAVKILGKLEEVMVSDCVAMQEVFNTNCVRFVEAAETERGDMVSLIPAMFPQLHKIELQDLPKMTSVWKGLIPLGSLPNLRELRVSRCDGLNYLQPEVLQALETLEITECGNIEKLTHTEREELEGTTSSNTQKHFPNLQQIRVFRCPRLKNLFSFDEASDLQKLHRLCIIQCDSLKELFGEEDELLEGQEESRKQKDLLPQLQYLELNKLPCLRSFYHENLPIICPLEEIKVVSCPSLIGLPLDPKVATSLHKIEGDFGWYHALEWHLEDGAVLVSTSAADQEDSQELEPNITYSGQEPQRGTQELEDLEPDIVLPGQDIGQEVQEIEEPEPNGIFGQQELRLGSEEIHELEPIDLTGQEHWGGVQVVNNDEAVGTGWTANKVADNVHYRYPKTHFCGVVSLVLLSLLGIAVVGKFKSPTVIFSRGIESLFATPEFNFLEQLGQHKFTFADWNSEQESYLIDLMAETVIARGDHTNTIERPFSEDEWFYIRTLYYNRWGTKHNSKAFKDKFVSLRQRLTEFNELVENYSGLEWNSELSTLDAPHLWWNNYVHIQMQRGSKMKVALSARSWG